MRSGEITLDEQKPASAVQVFLVPGGQVPAVGTDTQANGAPLAVGKRHQRLGDLLGVGVRHKRPLRTRLLV